ncbi:MAG: DUF2892 domain-containing protein [Candidatus Omnitrophica bacterium]|nr:DUF2892 domain-containing protein [Candidatus Omnitrophota bacterium]
MFRRMSQMPAEEVFTRTFFGVVLILSAFISWGRWITLVLGILFLLSAYQGFCLTCYLYKKFVQKKNS